MSENNKFDSSEYYCPVNKSECRECSFSCKKTLNKTQVEPVAFCVEFDQAQLGRPTMNRQEAEEVAALVPHKRRVVNLFREAPTAGAQSWEPIETAPKDNERALYLARFNESGELVELDFNGAWEYWQESWELAHINGYAWVSENGIEEPTHWAYQDLPLPKITTNPAAAINEQLLFLLKEVNRQAKLGRISGRFAFESTSLFYLLEDAIAAAEATKKVETPYQTGQRLYRNGVGISDIWGAVKSDVDMDECQRGYDDAAKGGV